MHQPDLLPQHVDPDGGAGSFSLQCLSSCPSRSPLGTQICILLIGCFGLVLSCTTSNGKFSWFYISAFNNFATGVTERQADWALPVN